MLGISYEFVYVRIGGSGVQDRTTSRHGLKGIITLNNILYSCLNEGQYRVIIRAARKTSVIVGLCYA